MKYEVKNPIVIEDKEKKKIRTMVKIGEIDFAFMSNVVDSSSMEKYFNFSCNDPLLSGACKVLGLEEEKVTDAVKNASLELFNETVEALKEAKIKYALEQWKGLGYWKFIEEFKKEIPEGCTVSHLSYEEGIELIKEDRPLGIFPTIYVKTPYSTRDITIEEKTAYSSSSYYSKPSYIYYEITCGYDEKFGRPRKQDNIISKVHKAIETLKKRKENQDAEVKRKNEVKKSILSKLDKSFVVEEERKYSKFRGGGSSWVETKYISDFLIVRQCSENKFSAHIKANLTADQVKKLNNFLKTLGEII